MNNKEKDIYDFAVLDQIYFEILKNICHRLYSPNPLSGDERRDLANSLQNIIWSAETINESEIK